MSVPIEGIVRPFADHNVFPARFTKPGQQGVQLVRVAIGFQGSIKTMGYSFSATQSTRLGQTHKEKDTASGALKSNMQKLHDSIG